MAVVTSLNVFVNIIANLLKRKKYLWFGNDVNEELINNW